MMKNIPQKLAALILAILFWLFIVGIENSYVQFAEEIPIKAFNLGEQLALAEDPGTVKITLKGESQDIFRALSPADFEAYVDLSGLGTGEKTLEISVRSKNSGVSIVKVEPSEMTVNIEPVRYTQIPLEYEIVGTPAEGFTVDKVELGREFVGAHAADAVLKSVSVAKARVELSGVERGNMVKTVPVAAYNDLGTVVSNLQLEEEFVEAKIYIIESEHRKEVGVTVPFENALQNGIIEKISVNPSVVEIVGRADTVSKIDALSTEPVDLSKLTSGVIQKRKLVLPEGVTLEKGVSAFVEINLQVKETP